MYPKINLNYRFLKTLDNIFDLYSSNKISFIDINSFIYKNWNNEFTKVHLIGEFNFIVNTHLVIYSTYFVRFRLALSFLTSSLKCIQKPKILICGTSLIPLEGFNESLLKKINLLPIVRCFDHRFPGFLSNRYKSSYYLRYFEFDKHGFFSNFFSSSRKKSLKMLDHHIKFYTNPNLLIILSLNRDSSIGKAALSRRIPALALSNSDSFNFGFSGITYTIPFPSKTIILFENNPLIIFFFLIIKLIESIHLENAFKIVSNLEDLSVKDVKRFGFPYHSYLLFKRQMKQFLIDYIIDTPSFLKKVKKLQQSSIDFKYYKFFIQRQKSIISSYFLSCCLRMVWHKKGLMKRMSSQLILFEKNNNLFTSFLKMIKFLKLFKLNFLNLNSFKQKQENKKYNIFSIRRLKIYYTLRNYVHKKWVKSKKIKHVIKS